MRDKVMHVTKYHLSRFPPVKQMSRYWSVHTIVQEGLVLNFLWLSRSSDAALMPVLYHISERGLCWCGRHGFYQEARLLQTRDKILGISLTNFMDSSAGWERTYSTLGRVLSPWQSAPRAVHHSPSLSLG